MRFLRKIAWAIAALFLLAMITGWWTYSRQITLAGYGANTDTLVWAHRGGGKRINLGENTVQGAQNSLQSGIQGIELDIFYDLDLKDIIVSHDKPYQLVDNKPRRLSDFGLSSETGLWLDVKNLDSLGQTDLQHFATILQELGLAQNSLIESPDLGALYELEEYGLRTMFWAYADDGRSPVYYIALKLLAPLAGIDMISVSINSLHHLEPHFNRSSLATFTLNSTASLCNARQRAKLVLSGLHPQDITTLSCDE